MKAVLGILAAIVLALNAGCGGCGFNTSPGTGEKIGQIVWITQEGLRPWCQTWEAQLIRGGMTGGSGTIGTQPFQFTITDPTQLATAQQFMREQTEAVITYRQAGHYTICSSGTGGKYLTGIRPAKGG